MRRFNSAWQPNGCWILEVANNEFVNDSILLGVLR